MFAGKLNSGANTVPVTSFSAISVAHAVSRHMRTCAARVSPVGMTQCRLGRSRVTIDVDNGAINCGATAVLESASVASLGASRTRSSRTSPASLGAIRSGIDLGKAALAAYRCPLWQVMSLVAQHPSMHVSPVAALHTIASTPPLHRNGDSAGRHDAIATTNAGTATQRTRSTKTSTR